MGAVARFLTRTRGRGRADLADWLTYGYLLLGLAVVAAPVLWLFLSSFKTESELAAYPPRFLPRAGMEVKIPGRDRPLRLYAAEVGGVPATLALRRVVGARAMLTRPETGEELQLPRDALTPIEIVRFAWENYADPLRPGGVSTFKFARYFANSVIVTLAATLITLLANAMAAFALSKYRFRGRDLFLVLIVSALMIPPTVILVPLFFIVQKMGMFNSLWGVIIPGAATPTGVFMLRQYMLTIPDHIIDAARMDGASEWRVFWRIVLPLAMPAVAVLGILSVIWRWNDFLWPLIALQDGDNYTLQLGLNSFRGENEIQWRYLLAMTVLSLLPVTAVFVFLQRHITTGVASLGVK